MGLLACQLQTQALAPTGVISQPVLHHFLLQKHCPIFLPPRIVDEGAEIKLIIIRSTNKLANKLKTMGDEMKH